LEIRDSDDEADFRASARRWLAEHIAEAPDVEYMPGSADLAAWRRWSRRLNEAGFAGLTWPEADGGRGLGHACTAIWAEEVARAGVPDHIGIIGVGMAGPTIIDHGTDEQRSRFLAPTLNADIVWCQGFSEPSSGSDLASVRTRARRDDDDWIVDGQKVWSSWAHAADWCILLVRTEDDLPSHQALSFLLLDMRSPGVTVRPLTQLTGDPEFNEIFLDGVRVPRSLTLGEAGAGWRVAMTTLKHERRGLGLGLAGRLDAAVRDVTALVTRTGPDGQRPANDPDVTGRIVDSWIESQALRALNLRVISAIAGGEDAPPFGTVTKLRWSEANQRLMSLAVEAAGTDALAADPDDPASAVWAFHQLRSRGNTIEAGTSEVLRTIIAERVLGLPRSR
jgi:alkylation response protein AidB-like acyl-CoA dehydrogenase